MNQVEKHIGVLDGVRAISIAMVAWFHFWQQSWLTPSVKVPEIMKLCFGIQEFNLEGFVRNGYLFVDMLILISAICNFYPYARSILLDEPWPDTRTFYKKRAVRILPSYFLAVVIMLALALGEHKYYNTGFMMKDVLVHVFFVKTFFHDVMSRSPINAVLWTVQIEVLYYILMPWIAKLFKKVPLATCLILWGCTLFSVQYYTHAFADNIFYWNNNMLTYACCYANGFLVCMLYIRMKQNGVCDKYSRIASVIMFLASILVLNNMVNQIRYYNGTLQTIQMQLRLPMSFVFSVMALSLMFAPKWLEIIFSNRLLAFLGGISYNFYIWHQFIACVLKQYRIPYWEGEQSPNLLGDRVWMWKYQILIVVVSLVTAVILTYGFEIPVAKKLKKFLKI